MVSGGTNGTWDLVTHGECATIDIGSSTVQPHVWIPNPLPGTIQAVFWPGCPARESAVVLQYEGPFDQPGVRRSRARIGREPTSTTVQAPARKARASSTRRPEREGRT